MLIATADDGVRVHAHDQGSGPAVLILPPGMDDGASWKRVADTLGDRFRVLRLHRRQYRLDLRGGWTMAEELRDIRVLVELIDEPMVLVGHSSGAVLALEALAAMPTAFAGAVLYEPPCVTGAPLGGAALARARAALAAGRTGRALAIFLGEIVDVPRWLARLSGLAVPLFPRLRRFAPRQLDDCAAIDGLGVRMQQYEEIAVPTVLLGGDRSPAHLAQRMDALEHVLPRTERVVLHGQGHGANTLAPTRVAAVISRLADDVLGPVL